MKKQADLEAMEKSGKPMKGVYRLPGGGRKAVHVQLDWILDLRKQNIPKRPSRLALRILLWLFLIYTGLPFCVTQQQFGRPTGGGVPPTTKWLRGFIWRGLTCRA